MCIRPVNGGQWATTSFRNAVASRLAPFLLVLLAAGLKAPGLWTPGYFPDEELTHFSVQGIRAHGLPVLPSGNLYDRGVLYSFFAWLSGSIAGFGFPSYRFPAFLASAITPLVLFYSVRRFAGVAVAFAAGTILAVSPFEIFNADWARFYSLTTLSYLGAFNSMLNFAEKKDTGKPFLLWFCVCRLCHEFGLTLLALPIGAVIAVPDERRYRSLAMQSAGAAVVLQGGLVALNLLTPARAFAAATDRITLVLTRSWVTPPLGAAALASATTWVAIALALSTAWFIGAKFYRAPRRVWGLTLLTVASYQLGCLACLVWSACVLQPKKAVRYIACGALAAAIAVAWWTIHTALAANAALTGRLATSLASASAGYPLDAVRYAVSQLPVTGAAFFAVTVLVARAGEGELPRLRRQLTLWLIATNLLILGVMNTPLTWRYLMLSGPLFLLVIAEWVTMLKPVLALVVLAAALVEQQAYARRENLTALMWFDSDLAVPHAQSSEWQAAARLIEPDAAIITNDELACLYAIGRVDYWLVLDDFDRERTSVSFRGLRTGWYGGATIAESEDDLGRIVAESPNRPHVFFALKSGKYGFARHRAIALDLMRRTNGRLVADTNTFTIVQLPAKGGRNEFP